MPDIRQTSDDRVAVPRPTAPDYELADAVDATTPAQMKALGDPIRQAILTLVLERAATTTELAIALERPKGTVDHHLKVLAAAGMVTVVRTRKVRAMTERFWGRTARTIKFAAPDHEMSRSSRFVRDALDEIVRVPPPADAGGEEEEEEEDDLAGYTTLRHARIPTERIREFGERLDALAVEFVSTPRGGDTVFGMLIALYPTDRAILPPADQEPA